MNRTITGRFCRKTFSCRAFRRTALFRVASLVSGLVYSTGLLALPQLQDFDSVNGGVIYNVNGNQGDLVISADNRVVEFFGQGVDVAQGETLTFDHDGTGVADWSLLVRDISGSASTINGILARGANGGVRVAFINTSGMVFGANASVDLASLISSTHDMSNGEFTAGNLHFARGTSSGTITINGLSSSSSDAQLAFISGGITADGAVDIDGNLNLVAGEAVIVSYDSDGLMQFDISEALQSSGDAISVSAGGDISAANINLLARVGDPLTLAVNNAGVVRAVGIDSTSTPGVVRLHGVGGTVKNTGSLIASGSNGDGEIEIRAADVILGGQVDGGSTGHLAVVIGDESDFGMLLVDPVIDFNLGSASVVGIGQANLIEGLANYIVSSLNGGTAGHQGIGTAAGDWSNVAAISFSNIADLYATSETGNILQVLAGGQLLEIDNGARFGSLEGGNRNDSIMIAGKLCQLR